MKMIQIICLVVSLLTINSLKEMQTKTLKVNYLNHNFVGIKGDIAFTTNKEEWFSILNVSNIEDLTKFKATVTTDKNTEKYDINCRLWLNNDKKIFVLCKFERNLPLDDNKINISESFFIFEDYNITINFESISNKDIRQYSLNFPILYASSQKIIYSKDKDYYDVKFFANSYIDESIILIGETTTDFENCKYIDINKNELNCQISRAQLEQKMYKLGEKHDVYIVSQEKGFIEQNLVGRTEAETGDIQKEDIYVGITHLIYNTTSTTVFYETNVTNLPFIKTSYYEFEITEPPAEYQCAFIGGEKKLIMGCFAGYNSEGTYYLAWKYY